MTQSDQMASLLDDIIQKTRKRRGVDVIPYSVTSEEILRVVRLVDAQYRLLKKENVTLPYEEVTKRVCEAQTFSEDPEENWFLQYAYQVLAMLYFGHRSKKKAAERLNRKLDLASQEKQQRGRESLV